MPSLHDALLGHVMQRDTDLPLVDPGNPDGSYLFRVLSRCDPDGGAPMPANAPTLLDDDVVAIVCERIAAGAPG